MAAEQEAIRRALETDRTIDIVTIGARTGKRRTTEIWFVTIDGGIYICGTPSADGSNGRPRRRDWLANMIATPTFEFCLKESLDCTLAARAEPITDPIQRRTIMSAPETQWYRDQVDSIDRLISHSPIVRVHFTGDHASLS